MNFTSPLERLQTPWTEKAEVDFFIKRDDLVHPTIMGNKWRKLKYNLVEAKKLGKKTLLTFGGAYSNHIHATAAAAKEHGFSAIGMIRGEELQTDSNPTLQFASAQGMELRFISRSHFRAVKENPSLLNMDLSNMYILPEGGTNALAIKGCVEIIEEVDVDYDYLVTSIGTGGTFAGLVSGSRGKGEIIGISSLKGDFAHKNIVDLLNKNQIIWHNYRIITNYHFGGYGRTNEELIDFINSTYNDEELLLDPIYTAKAFYAVKDLIMKNQFRKGSKIVFLHTGGLQGIDGFNQKHDEKIYL